MATTWETLYSWVSTLYGEHDKTLTTPQILSRLLEEASELVNPILRLDKDAIQEQLPDIVSWIIGLIIHLEETYPNFSTNGKKVLDEVLQKYKDPKIALPFPSEIINVNTIQLKNSEILEGLDARRSIREWQEYFKMVYKNINDRLPPDFFMSQLLLDLGMLVKFIRNKEDSKEIKSKIAAIIAWTFAIANKFDIDLENHLGFKYRDQRLVVLVSNPDAYLRDFITKHTSALCVYPEDYERFEEILSSKIAILKSRNFVFVKVPNIVENYTTLPEFLSNVLLHDTVFIIANELLINGVLSGIAMLLALSLAKPVRLSRISLPSPTMDSHVLKRRYLPNVVILTISDTSLEEELYTVYPKSMISAYVDSGLVDIRRFKNEKEIVDFLVNEAMGVPLRNGRGTLLDYIV